MPRKPAALPKARAAALECLESTLAQGLDVQEALDRILEGASLSPRDAALATELVYGSLRLKGRVEFLLSRFLRRPAGLPERVRLGLVLAGYELLFLSRIPAYASVNWAVDLARAEAGERVAGVANAVLRRLFRLGRAAFDPDRFKENSNLAALFSRFYSCPEWIVRLWLSAYGRERAEQYLTAQIAPPALGLWLNPAHPETPGLAESLRRHPACLAHDGFGLAFAAGTKLSGLGLEGHGAVQRQSFAARQALLALCPTAWPTPVWDACAGRGNKTRVLIEQGVAPVYASDIRPGRVAALAKALPDVPAFVAAADRPAPLQNPVGTVLLDLPCSGLGVLSRRPDAKWKRRPEDLAGVIDLQGRILDQAFAAMRPGGRLAVLTCTLNPDENEGLIERFVRRTASARLETAFATPPESKLGEFFFAALLARA